jgi:DNA-binding FadR family transcriptional regulator
LARKPSKSPALVFQPISRPRAFEEICDRIRHQLSIGALQPGDKLPAERELAQQLGVSRSALREALRSLEIAGIVVLRKGVTGGAFIRPGDPTTMTRVMQDLVHLGSISLADLTEARVMIQTAVVRMACERATEADIEKIAENIENTAEMTRLGRHEDRLRFAMEFYRLLALSTRNEIMTMLVDALTVILLRFLSGIRNGAPQPGLIESRRRFLRHLKARDAAKASREIELHLTKLHKLLTQSYAQSPTSAERQGRAGARHVRA